MPQWAVPIYSGLTVTCTGRPDLVLFHFNTSQNLPLIVNLLCDGLISHPSLYSLPF
jgi:hypothetical protein